MALSPEGAISFERAQRVPIGAMNARQVAQHVFHEHVEPWFVLTDTPTDEGILRLRRGEQRAVEVMFVVHGTDVLTRIARQVDEARLRVFEQQSRNDPRRRPVRVNANTWPLTVEPDIAPH